LQILKRIVYPRTGYESREEWQGCTFTLSLTSSLDGGRWLKPRPGHFTPCKLNGYAFYRRVGGQHGLCGLVREAWSNVESSQDYPHV